MRTEADKAVFESTDTMSAECKSALRNLILACADTKLLLGYHYGEWTFGPPELEAAIACCSLCQTELGHVRLLHAILNTHYSDDPDDLVESRKPDEFANISYLDEEIKDWPEFVAANYIVDLAITSLLHSMRDSSFKPLHMSLGKMLQEERYHVHHGQGWFRTLGTKNNETKAAMERSARSALLKVAEWFGPADSPEDTALVEAGVKADKNDAILQQLLGELAALTESLQMNLGISRQDGGGWSVELNPDWSGWNSATRRLDKSGPNEDILYHLRGSKNKVFKLN
jgi:ring-1,2-phenylacetyl-CoA epoxidase subunit PaaC